MKKKRLGGSLPLVTEAIDPAHINWHNFEAMGFTVYLRNFGYFFFFLLFCLLSFYIAKIINNLSIPYKVQKPNIICQADVTEQMALIDYVNPIT
jgi:hypothetical protein